MNNKVHVPELTQPGDLSAAFTAPGSGLSIDVVTEIATDDLPDATTALFGPLRRSQRL